MTRNIPLLTLLTLATLCFAAPLIGGLRGIDSDAGDLALRFLPPSATHWLGTDELGRDLFLRLLRGGQVSLSAAFIAALICAAFGTAVGVTAGYFRGTWDAFLMRATDMMVALPALPLLIVLSAVDLQKLGFSADAAVSQSASLYKIIILTSLFGWVSVARLARARTLSLGKRDFVLSARALGVGHARIMLRHILPNLMNTVIVATTLAAGNIILMESVLSFLGLGIQPPMASWGNMLTNAEDNIWEHAELTFYPGAMIFVTVLCFNLLGDRLQDALDPKAANHFLKA